MCYTIYNIPFTYFIIILMNSQFSKLFGMSLYEIEGVQLPEPSLRVKWIAKFISLFPEKRQQNLLSFFPDVMQDKLKPEITALLLSGNLSGEWNFEFWKDQCLIRRWGVYKESPWSVDATRKAEIAFWDWEIKRTVEVDVDQWLQKVMPQEGGRNIVSLKDAWFSVETLRQL